MNRIAERAASLGLTATADALAPAKLDAATAPGDARLEERPAQDLKRLLGQMVRRGHAPLLVRALWDKLAGRPLERALVAVDVLAQSLWSPRDNFVIELRAATTLLGTAAPAPGQLGIDLNRHQVSALIARAGLPGSEVSTTELVIRAFDQSLAVLDELRRRGDDLVARDATRDSIRSLARLFALARLPTLASVYFDWLIRDLGWREPALDLCETLFDARAAHKIPADTIRAEDLRASERDAVGEYVLLRSHMSVGDDDTANDLLMRRAAAGPATPSPQLDVVRAHLSLLYGRDDLSLDKLDAACADDPLWRYAARVRSLVAARQGSPRALDLYHAALTSFGNDYDSSAIVLSLVPEPLKRDIARISCREAFYLPHEPTPWKLLGLLFGVEASIDAEIAARVRWQTAP